MKIEVTKDRVILTEAEVQKALADYISKQTSGREVSGGIRFEHGEGGMMTAWARLEDRTTGAHPAFAA